MKEAMEEVKNELGPDAVILHTKKYQEGGLMGYNSKEVVEVTAAIEEHQVEQKQAVRPAVPLVPPSVLGKYKTNGTPAGVEMASSPIPAPKFQQDKVVPQEAEKTHVELPPEWQEALGLIPAKPVPEEPAPDRPAQKAPPADDVPAAAGKEAEDEMEMKEEKDTKPDGRKPSGNKEDEEKIQKLESELAQMKTLLAQVMSKDAPKDEVSLQEALRLQDVEEDILKDMAGKTVAGGTLIDSLDPQAKEILTGYLDQVVNFSEGIKLNKHGVRIVALIGATGVGKTTTLAKIAANFVLEKGVKAAMVTADTYRISAVEQLKTYSDIIGLPLEIVYSPQELKVAIHKHRDKDLILIDTAGRSQHNDYQMKELKEFLAVDSRIEKHLVMSSTTKNRDAADILDKFSMCKPNRVIFTKTDETGSVGLILNLLSGKNIALSYLTNGQSVPDDIVPATPEKLAELLLRE